ncbi:MAG: glucose-6-phosphate dehydrogenase [Armatimonadetes bacterium]|nr:glucose-6-phosphate dehydrogenase [Armatimonadota bacterium]
MIVENPAPAENPRRKGLRLERVPEPCAVVILGATGDLTKRKLAPALYNLAVENLLPENFALIGFARRPQESAQFRDAVRQGLDQFSRSKPIRASAWERFAENMHYISSPFEDPKGYEELSIFLKEMDQKRGCRNRIFYLAVPPESTPGIVEQLGNSGLSRPCECAWTRLIVEKPFGSDLATACKLNQEIAAVFAENQVYRMDHYLGKETVQNLLVFRFANGIYEPIWNRRYIDHVQITVSEHLGMEGRGASYEEAGALRDIMANHMVQLLCMIGMEPSVAFDADSLRDEKTKLIKAVHPPPDEPVGSYAVRGQYGPGWVEGLQVPGYRNEPKVAPQSSTETYVALKLFIDNWRWAGVPFYLRTGKRLPKRTTEIAIQFKPAPHLMFSKAAVPRLDPNLLAVRVQPDEGISLRFGAKVPGPSIHIRAVNMDFTYGTAFTAEPPEAYETLLLDCMLGDPTLFMRGDEVEAAWGLMTPILEGWSKSPEPPFPNYEAGSWGPERALELIERDGRKWRRL